MKKATLAILLGYACAIVWTIVADLVYHNHVPEDDIQFHGLYPISLGLSAIVACLIFDGNIKAIHLRRCSWKYIWIGIFISSIMLLIPFSINLVTGLVHFGDPQKMDATLAIIGIPVLILLALGEEVMWRGLLYTEFMKRYSFFTTGIIIGILWAIWHFPVIIHTKFVYGEYPLWYVLPVFTIGVTGMNFFLMYLRKISDSIWPAVMWHAFINYIGFIIIQPLENPDTPSSLYFKSDIGIFYALMYVVIGIFYYRKFLRDKKMEAVTG